MGWLSDIFKPITKSTAFITRPSNTLAQKLPGTPENLLKKGKRAAQSAKKALQSQEDADRIAAYEAEVNLGVSANRQRVAARGPRTLGGAALATSAVPRSAGLGAAPSPSAVANNSLTDILARIRGIQF